MNIERIVRKIWLDCPLFDTKWKDNSQILNCSESARHCFNFIKACEEHPDFKEGHQYAKSKVCYDLIKKNVDKSLRSNSSFVKTFAKLILKEKHDRKRNK